MGDTGDYWRDVKPVLKEKSQEKRLSNYENALRMLKSNNINFEEKPNGHFIIHDGDKFDFWATTGLFINRKNKKRGRGIKSLLRFIKRKEDDNE